MDPNRWRQIDELFHAAVDHAPNDRCGLLDRRCGNDSELRQEVESLLAAHAQSSSCIDVPAFDVVPRASLVAETNPLTGRTIGHFQINQLIGVGGMGAVYEAEQESPRRTVALKLRRALPFHDELSARMFQREGQALARLQHTGIAAIYEAGQSDDGWYYFAMERILGQPLMEFVLENNLPVGQRLELFIRICDAVHYAHQRGVIHRDLKPSNILVTNEAQPKILDFGLARIVDPDANASQITQAGAFHGTLAYASPEQTWGRPDDIDVRSDVYSLGVILYELLTRKLPYELAGLTLSEAGRIICEQALRPAGTIDRSLRGELETIAGKALEKEPDCRYASAAALGEDIRRFLHQQPILAHAPSVMYQFRKFTRRHRGLMASMASILLLLAGSSVWMSVLYARAMRAEKRAQEEARQAELKATKSKRVTAFLKGVFSESTLHLSSTSNMTAEDLLNKDVERIYAELGDQPDVQGELLEVLAMVFINRGSLDRAVELHEASWKSRAKVFGDRAPDIAASVANMGYVLYDLDRFREAEKYDRLALDIFRSNYGMENYFSATAFSNLARVISERDPTAAESMNREALEIFRKIRGEKDGAVARSKQYLAETLDRSGRYEESERLCREVIAFLGEPGKTDEIRFVRVQRDLASALMHQHRYDEALVACRTAVELCRNLFGADPHFVYGEMLCMQAAVEEAAGDFPQARTSYEIALSMVRAVHHSPHLDLADALSGSARSLGRDGASSAAVPLFEESLAIRRELLDPPDPRLLKGLRELADGLRAAGRPDEADRLSREETQMLAKAASP